MRLRERAGVPGLYGLVGLVGLVLLGLGLQTTAQGQIRFDEEPDVGPAGRPAPSLPAGTLLKLSPVRQVSSRTARLGDPIHLRLHEDVYAGPAAVIPAGTLVEGTIARVRRPGFIARRSRLRIHLDRLLTRGMALDLNCTDVTLKGATTLGKKALSGMTTVAAGSVSPLAGILAGTRLLRRGPEIRIGPPSLFVTRLVRPLEIPLQLTGSPARNRRRQKP